MVIHNIKSAQGVTKAADPPQQLEVSSISHADRVPQAFDDADPSLHPHSMVTSRTLPNQRNMDKLDHVLFEPTSENPLVPEEDAKGKMENELTSPEAPKTDVLQPKPVPKKARYYAKNLSQQDAKGKMENKLTSLQAPKSDVLQPKPIPKKARYYANNLSQEDKHALSVGELNHNLKEWTPNDLIRFQEGRLGLIHEGLENREELLDLRLKEMQKSQQYVAQYKKRNEEVRRHLRAAAFTKAAPVLPAANYLQNTQPSRHISASGASASLLSRRPPSSPLSQLTDLSELSVVPTASKTPEVPFQEGPTLPPAGSHVHTSTRAASLHSEHPRRRPESYHLSISTSLQRSWPMSSPLNIVGSEEAPKVVPHESRPDVTFDLFLAPHISGKGEAFRGADNAKKEEDIYDRMEDDNKTANSAGSRKNPVRRLSKMASMPSLRIRKTPVRKNSLN